MDDPVKLQAGRELSLPVDDEEKMKVDEWLLTGAYNADKRLWLFASNIFVSI